MLCDKNRSVEAFKGTIEIFVMERGDPCRRPMTMF